MEKYDVIIVGAGISGSVSAYILSKHMNVLVLEKKKLPRYKTCGGGITNKTLKFLRKIGIDIKNDLIENYIDRIRVKILGSEKVIEYNEPLGILTYRDVFDYYLLKKSNADILDETKVLDVNVSKDKICVKTSRGRFISDYLIGCDGATSVVKRKFFEVEKEMGVAAQLETNKMFNEIYIDFDIVKNGYAWIFPKRKGSTIGVGYIRGEEKEPIRSVLKKFLKNINVSYKEEDIKIHPLPYFIGRKNVVYKNVVCICGDAANLIDPLLGEGTFNAALSAYLASEAILKGNLGLYEKMYLDSIYKHMKRAYLISKIFYSKKEFSKYILMRTSFFEEFLKCICNEIECYSKGYFMNILKLIPLYVISKIYRFSK